MEEKDEISKLIEKVLDQNQTELKSEVSQTSNILGFNEGIEVEARSSHPTTLENSSAKVQMPKTDHLHLNSTQSPQLQGLQPLLPSSAKVQPISINNHIWYTLEDNIISLINGHFSLIMETGEPGMGKSYQTVQRLKELIPNNYARCSCHVSPLELYNQLFINKDKKIIVFDDIDNLTNKTIISLLKSACEVEQVRNISWLTTSPSFKKLGIPSNFILNSGIILIFNESIDTKEFSPVMSRGVCIPFKFTFEEKIKEFENASLIDREIIDYIKKYCNSATKNLSVRTMIILTNKKNGGTDWEDTARIMLKTDPLKQLLIEMLENHNGKPISTICNEWCNKSNKSRRTFYNYKNELDGKEIQIKAISDSIKTLETLEK